MYMLVHVFESLATNVGGVVTGGIRERTDASSTIIQYKSNWTKRREENNECVLRVWMADRSTSYLRCSISTDILPYWELEYICMMYVYLCMC